MQRNRRSILTRFKEGSARSSLEQEFNLAFVLVLIVVVFFACNFLKAALNAFEFYVATFTGSDLEVLDQNWFIILTVVSNFLIIANSVINFVVYMVVATPFRQALVKACNSVKSYAQQRTVVASTQESKTFFATPDIVLSTDGSKVFLTTPDTTVTAIPSPPVLIPRQPIV